MWRIRRLDGSAKVEKKADLVSVTMMLAGSIEQNGMDKRLLVLFDSGSQECFAKRYQWQGGETKTWFNGGREFFFECGD